MNDSTPQPAYVERYAEYYRRLGHRCTVLDGRLWIEERRMIMPMGPSAHSYCISADEAKTLLGRSPSAMLVRWTDGFHPGWSSGKWYAVVCRQFQEIEQHDANTRRKIRKALKECTVEKVDARCIAERGYETYVASRSRYQRAGNPVSLKSKDQFRQGREPAADFSDILDFWAIFCQGNLVTFVQVERFGNTEATYGSISFHPDYFKFYISYGLFHVLNQYYLREQSFAYVNDGFRSVLHNTGIQQFLMEAFAFERAYTNLYLAYRRPLSWFMSLPAFVRNWAGRVSTSVAALNALQEARTVAAAPPGAPPAPPIQSSQDSLSR
jgi:hypothetical protein